MLLPFRLAASRFAGSSYARRLANRHLGQPMDLAVVVTGLNVTGINDNDANAYRSTANYAVAPSLPAFDHAASFRRPQLRLVLAGGRL